MRAALVILLLLSCAYLMTGVVYQEGGFEVRLVIKPAPSLSTSFGGGEEGAWERANPGAPHPWWLRGEQREIVSGDWEGGQPFWLQVYMLGFLGVALAWPAALVVYIVRAVRRFRRVRARL